MLRGLPSLPLTRRDLPRHALHAALPAALLPACRGDDGDDADAATWTLMTGLAPGSAWDLAGEPAGDETRHTLTAGTALTADEGGVLLVSA